jgi:serine/threonine-protein kinase
MDTLMETDELKAAWQALERRMTRQDQFSLHLFREGRLEKARSSLRPLFWGQLVQIVFGVAMIVLGVACWTPHRDLPVLLVSGILVHAYGVATTAMAGLTLGLIGLIDYSAPVLTIQRHLARLRRFYICNGMIAGLSWWLLWLPFVIALGAVVGGNLTPAAPGMLVVCLAIGIPGLLASAWIHRWRRRRAGSDACFEDALGGSSIQRSQRVLDELARFERE